MLQSSDDLDNYRTVGTFFTWGQMPANAPIDYGIMYIKKWESQLMQVCTRKSYAVEKIFFRIYESYHWGEWQELATNIPSFYKNYNDLASLQTALGVNTKLRNLGNLQVDAVATNTMNVGAYAGVLFIINQDYGHVSIIATSYNESTEIVHKSSAGTFSASCVNKTLSITNNGSSQIVYSISLLL